MKKIWMAVIGIAVLLTAVLVTGCSSDGGVTISGDTSGLNINLSNQQAGIWVSGEGKVTAVPDVAVLSLGIEAQEATVAEAQDKAAQAMASVMEALKNQGVAEKDIQTQYYSIQDVTRWDEFKDVPTIIGYRVTNTVTAKIRDVANAGTVIDAVAAAGGNLTRINSIGFTVDDPSSYYAEARQKAVAEAEAKAQQMAELTGVKLGRATYVSENTYTPGPIYRADMVAEAVAGAPAVTTPISAGEMEITTNVQIAYAIE